MIYNIKRDHARFRSIVKGKIKQDLKKYVTHGEMIGRKGKDIVTIPLPQIEIPRFGLGIRSRVAQVRGRQGGRSCRARGSAARARGRPAIRPEITCLKSI